ncbi:tetratricopeptide repeat protein [Luteimonas yindakuii]|uniref:Tetratricopeptide repeat protein n=1 Tax=Luteimonas yindakuii TaxID=2565782 RepID=A0A4Z1RC99_9GAMM|nr:tetratricopeptide repeat protein [Luteimonas yindakuii]TKS53803.1 tetratricopeptide repeat protein [Luteimonas yindakuii]
MPDRTIARPKGRSHARYLSTFLALVLAGCASHGSHTNSQAALPEWERAHVAAVAAYQAGNYTQSAEHARLAHQAVVATLGPQTDEAAGVLSMLAAAELANGRHAEAAEGFEASLRILRAVDEPQARDITGALNNLGELYRQQDELDRALPYFEEAHATSEAAFGATAIESARTRASLAMIRHQLGHLDQAQRDYATALELMDVAGAAPGDKARVRANQADLLARMGDTAAARAALEDVLAIEEAHLPADHPNLAYTLNSLAVVADAQKQHAEALTFYERALAIRRATLPPEHPALAVILGNMAGTYADMGNTSEARARYVEAIRILRSGSGSGSGGGGGGGNQHPDLQAYEAGLRALD